MDPKEIADRFQLAAFNNELTELRGKFGRKGKRGGSSKTPTASVTVDTKGWRGGFARSGAASAQIKTVSQVGVNSSTNDRRDLKDVASIEKWFKEHGVTNLDDITHDYVGGMFVLTYAPPPFFSSKEAVVSYTSGMEGLHKGWGMDYDKFFKTYRFRPEKYPELFKVSKSGSTVFPTQKHSRIDGALGDRASANATSVGTRIK